MSQTEETFYTEETLTVSFQIEPLALNILRNQAAWQGITLDELCAYYIGRIAGVMEEQHGKALVADAFKGLRERNAPTTQKGSPRYIEKTKEGEDEKSEEDDE